MKIPLIKQLLVIAFGALVSQAVFSDPDFWIDVRSQQEYEKSHVNGAVNIPHEQIRERITALTKNKEAEIYLYCRSGQRAGIAMNYLQSMGYTRVKNIGGLANAIKIEASTEP